MFGLRFCLKFAKISFELSDIGFYGLSEIEYLESGSFFRTKKICLRAQEAFLAFGFVFQTKNFFLWTWEAFTSI